MSGETIPQLPLVLSRPGVDTSLLPLMAGVFGFLAVGSFALGISVLPDPGGVPAAIAIFVFTALTAALCLLALDRLRPKWRGDFTLVIHEKGITYTRPQACDEIAWGDVASIGLTGTRSGLTPGIPLSAAITLAPAAASRRAAIKGPYANPTISLRGPWYGPPRAYTREGASAAYAPQELARLIDETRSACTGAPSIRR
ncbi:MAG: hypothetical protein JWN16_804 [Alphaproteobacteria bacterium]|nr:hypothetical protein [Alphaproteobacteria bacterium]